MACGHRRGNEFADISSRIVDLSQNRKMSFHVVFNDEASGAGVE